MRAWTLARTIALTLTLALAAAGVAVAKDERTKTVDGLVRTDIDAAGILYLRPDHGIGGYDAFRIAPVQISYVRGSRHMKDDLEEDFKKQLHDSLVDGIQRARIPITDKPGECVMQIGMALVDTEISRSTSAEILGKMILVMEFRDSMSRQPLLRFATMNRIQNENRARSRLLRKSVDEMVERMDLSTALRGAGLADDQIRPGCKGRLAALARERTKAAAQARD